MKTELCKVDEALSILVGKWKPIILLHLFNEDTLRFSELKRLMPNITQKMLTKQLRELEEEDIIERVVYPQVPPKVEYSISEYGKSLQPVLNVMHEWGSAHTQHMQEKRNKKSALFSPDKHKTISEEAVLQPPQGSGL
ncbi:hypothetical protein J6TS1_11660 [Siminovitchia terrae]|uniref:HxlR family transcriptional regulator n=1 Tax=Siminovitchia terrae TaxID=1914933 RepID=A0A429XCS3_SIMTE|nr:HxlR family transcriptional regulator [Siminovitchia terrae]GIN95296.1 hypothetical protein J6TS1_11660 [Siminovitchia terrae]